jgi:hypothetical protein
MNVFAFEFETNLDWKKADALREATGMTIDMNDGEEGLSPGRGWVDKVYLVLDRGGKPDLWLLEAVVHPSVEYDAAAVERCRDRIRKVLPTITSTWTEVPQSP